MTARLRSAAVILLLATGACGVLPDDHAVVGVLGRSVRRAADGVRSVSRAVDEGGRDLASLAVKVEAAPESAGRELARFGTATARLADGSTDRLVHFPGRVGEIAGQSVEDGVRRTGRLRDAPARVGLGIERNLASLRTAVGRAPRALDLDDTPMAGPGDPERTVEVVPATRQRSWLERIFDRMAF